MKDTPLKYVKLMQEKQNWDRRTKPSNNNNLRNKHNDKISKNKGDGNGYIISKTGAIPRLAIF